MIQMVVNSISFLGSLLCKLFWLSTVALSSHSSGQIHTCGLVVLNDFSELQSLLVFLVFGILIFGFFDIETLGLNTMEANSFHALHITIGLSASLRKILNKTDHCFITFHVKSIFTFCA